MFSAGVSATVTADDNGVPRFHNFRIRAYPEVVIEPGP
jgi:hypothetical protein